MFPELWQSPTETPLTVQKPLEQGPCGRTPNGPGCCARSRTADPAGRTAGHRGTPIAVYCRVGGQYSGQQDHATWQSPAELQHSVPKVGPVVAVVLMSELLEVSRRNGHEIAVLVGVSP